MRREGASFAARIPRVYWCLPLLPFCCASGRLSSSNWLSNRTWDFLTPLSFLFLLLLLSPFVTLRARLNLRNNEDTPQEMRQSLPEGLLLKLKDVVQTMETYKHHHRPFYIYLFCHQKASVIHILPKVYEAKNTQRTSASVALLRFSLSSEY